MPMPRFIALPADAHRAILRHCELAYPLEACGMLLGTKDGVVFESETLKNLSPKPKSSFALPMLSVFLSRWMLKRSRLRVIGFYHSHPNVSASPSPSDMAEAWPGHVTLIVRVQHGDAQRPRAWDCDGKVPIELPVYIHRGEEVHRGE